MVYFVFTFKLVFTPPSTLVSSLLLCAQMFKSVYICALGEYA